MRTLAFLCPYKGHLYIFKRAWEAELLSVRTESGEIKEFLFAKNDYEYLDEKQVKSLLIEQLYKDYSSKKYYLINLECKRCGHRLSISDRLYYSDHYV